MKQTRLDIFGYTDFRVFLKDRLAELKKENSKFSQSYFSDRLGLSSRSYLSMLIDGKRKLAETLTPKLAKVLGLNSEETAFFRELVNYGQAKTTDAKAEALENLRRNKNFLKVHRMALDHFDYMSDPLTLTLREMATLKDFREDAKWIAGRLPMKVGLKKIREALSRLERLGQLVRDDDGRLRVAHMHQTTGSSLGSVPLRTYHRKMLGTAADSIELPADTRHYGGITMSIPSESYKRIVERFEAFIDELRAIVDEGDDPEHVYHLEMSLFPLTRRDGEGNGEKR